MGTCVSKEATFLDPSQQGRSRGVSWVMGIKKQPLSSVSNAAD